MKTESWDCFGTGTLGSEGSGLAGACAAATPDANASTPANISLCILSSTQTFARERAGRRASGAPLNAQRSGSKRRTFKAPGRSHRQGATEENHRRLAGNCRDQTLDRLRYQWNAHGTRRAMAALRHARVILLVMRTGAFKAAVAIRVRNLDSSAAVARRIAERGHDPGHPAQRNRRKQEDQDGLGQAVHLADRIMGSGTLTGIRGFGSRGR